MYDHLRNSRIKPSAKVIKIISIEGENAIAFIS
jgi:hypothetical protein